MFVIFNSTTLTNHVNSPMSVADKANLVIAIMATCAFLISIWQSIYSVKTNDTNNRNAKEDRTQSALENKRTYELTLRQMNRANRVKLYIPLLAWMRGMWYDFDEGVKSIPPRVEESHPIFQTHAENLVALNNLILTFEFEAEMDLVATSDIQEAVMAWKPKMIAAGQRLERLKSRVRPEEYDLSAFATFIEEQESEKK